MLEAHARLVALARVLAVTSNDDGSILGILIFVLVVLAIIAVIVWLVRAIR